MEQKWGVGFALAQTPILLLEMLYRPEPIAVVYTTRVTNESLMTIDLEPTRYGLGPLFLTASLLVVMLGFVTMQLQEQDILDNAAEYSDEALTQTGLWSAMLWAIFVSYHVVLVLRLTSPVEGNAVVLAVLLQTMSIIGLCQPRSNGPRSTDSFLLLTYALGLMVVHGNMHKTSGMRGMALGAGIALDLLLVAGHVYDRNPNMQTVGNSRIWYGAMWAALGLGIYSS
jgi:hypothetical protein